MKKGYGLVLAGGGTKGSYQAGVWKALQELSIPITAIVGTSIGALNGAFMIQKDTKQLDKLYANIQITDIMNVKNIDQNKNIFDISNILSLAKNYKDNNGIENTPLKKLIEKNLDLDYLYNSSIDYGLVTYSANTKKPLELFKKDIPKDMLIEYILASACFPIFKPQKIGNDDFVDGGFYDKAPVNMLADNGYDNLIVVELGAVGITRKLSNKNVYLKVITPNEDLGGTFEFNKDRIQKNITMGYLDTLKSFNKLEGHIFYFKADEFRKMLDVFNLQTIYGLEYSAQLYGLDKYKMYDFETFTTLLKEKHLSAERKYNRIKKTLNAKNLFGIKNIGNVFDKGLGLCLVKDLYMDKPISNNTKYLEHFVKDYVIGAKALIELTNYME